MSIMKSFGTYHTPADVEKVTAAAKLELGETPDTTDPLVFSAVVQARAALILNYLSNELGVCRSNMDLFTNQTALLFAFGLISNGNGLSMREILLTIDWGQRLGQEFDVEIVNEAKKGPSC